MSGRKFYHISKVLDEQDRVVGKSDSRVQSVEGWDQKETLLHVETLF